MSEHVATNMQSIGFLRGRAGMVLRATLAQNVGTGCMFGGLGVSVLSLQDRFGSSLGTAAMGVSLTVLSMTALGPLIAGLITRFGLRLLMSIGVLISMVGYLALAYAPSMSVALAVCGLLIGPGAALFASLPPAILAGSWFPHAGGRVMGITYSPLLTTVLPLIGVTVIQRYGLTSFYVSLAAVHLLLLPLMHGVAEAPPEFLDEQGTAEETEAGSSPSVILGAAIFWLIVVGEGILNGTSIVGGSHMLPIVESYGVSEETGAMLLLVSGISAILGSLLAGYACDSFGSAKTLGLAGIGFAAAWLLIAMTGWLPALVVASVLSGICGASVFPPATALILEIFGIEALPRVLGLVSIMGIPFATAMSPAAGWLRDISGGYAPVYASLIGTCLVTSLIFFGIDRHQAWKRKSGAELPGAALPASNPA